MAGIVVKMLEKRLVGLFHLVGSECISKYDFGVRIARRFNFNPALVQPVSVEQAGLRAARSPNLSLRIDKLSQALGEHLPGVSAGLDRFFDLHQKGYPQFLKQLGEAHSTRL
jgi:dTDP-4-dehydrorhamnose reductase